MLRSSSPSDRDIPPLGDSLAREVGGRLNLPSLRPDAGGLRSLYQAWGHGLGMENISKRLRLLEGAGPEAAFIEPEEGFAGFLDNGTSGTCWPTMEMLVAWARALGFDARPRLGEMTQPGLVNHGSVVVVLDRVELSVDQNLLWPAPLPLDRRQPTRVEGPHYSAEACYDPGRKGFRIRRIQGDREFRPTFLRDGEVRRRDYLPLWKHSLRRSIFNRGYFVNRIRDGVWRQLDSDRYQESRPGAGLRTVRPPEDLPGFVADTMGIARSVLTRLLELERRSGG